MTAGLTYYSPVDLQNLPLEFVLRVIFTKFQKKRKKKEKKSKVNISWSEIAEIFVLIFWTLIPHF